MIPKEVYEIQSEIHNFPFWEYNEDGPEPQEWTDLQSRKKNCIRELVRQGVPEHEAVMMFFMAEDDLSGFDNEDDDFNYEEVLMEMLKEKTSNVKAAKTMHEKMKHLDVSIDGVPFVGNGMKPSMDRKDIPVRCGKMKVKKTRKDREGTWTAKVTKLD